MNRVSRPNTYSCRQISENENELIAARLDKARSDAAVNQAQEAVAQLRTENEKLMLEKGSTAEELMALKMYLVTMENVWYDCGNESANIIDVYCFDRGKKKWKFWMNLSRNMGMR